ncbi:MAG: hypothetical protein GY761_17535 [Hyphomicrobiales bacterium]|nr:hypothetical protein [Hyphomicrobiales bacterium]
MESSALKPYSSNATKANLDFCGTENGTRDAAGYILTNQLGPNGRPICFVFPGETDEPDASQIFLDVDQLEQSVNYKMVQAGHAYPLFYDTLFDDLREKFSDAVAHARVERQNVWSADVTNSGADWPGGEDAVGKIQPIFPKLWRRIQKYFKDEDYFDNARPFANLKKYIEIEASERVVILSENRITGFDNIIETTDTSVKMDVKPEDVVVVSVK